MTVEIMLNLDHDKTGLPGRFDPWGVLRYRKTGGNLLARLRAGKNTILGGTQQWSGTAT